jgi:two-component system, NarL family, response regulator NreC
MSASAPSETSPRTITIVLADDHRMVRSALEALLAAHGDLRVVDAVGDARSALLSVAEHRPAVLVLDLTMPGDLTALDAIPRIRRDFPDTRVVVLTMQRDPGFARRALRLGALGYVLKESADAELVEAVRRAAAGERYVADVIGELAAGGSGGDELTPREREVLRLIALGHTNAEIAERLTLSVRTVESHRAHIQHKLRRFRRAELVRYALDHRLVAA